MGIDCFVDDSGCVVCPALPAVADQPARVETKPVVGWNAGANSIAVLEGGLHVEIDNMPPNVAGAMLGLRSPRGQIYVPWLEEHAFYFFSTGGVDFVQVMESGAAMLGSPIVRANGDSFDIRRFGGYVTYWVNGEKVYSSAVKSLGPKLVTGMLYASGDTIGDVTFEAYADTMEGSGNGAFEPLTGFGGTDTDPVGRGVFPALSSRNDYDYVGTGSGQFEALVGFASPFSDSVGRGVLDSLQAFGIDDVFYSPEVNLAVGTLPQLRAQGNGWMVYEGVGAGQFGPVRGFATTLAGPIGVGSFSQTQAFGFRVPDYVGGVCIYQSEGYLYIEAANGADVLALSSLFFGDALTISEGFAIDEGLAFVSALTGASRRKMALAETLTLEDAFVIVNRLIFAEGLSLSDTSDITLHRFMELAELFAMADQTASRRDALMLVAVSAFIADQARTGSVVHIDESFLLTALADVQVRALIELLESLDLSDEVTMRLHALIVTSDALHTTDAASALRAARMGLVELLALGGTFRFAGIDYAIYAMTMAGAAVSEYAGWQFNSMCEIDGEYFGASDAGLASINGEDDDDGAQIDASLRLGISTLGTSAYKSVPKVYVGYRSSNGQLGLKVITTERGVKKENYYALRPIPRESDANGRFDVAKGLHSVYWGFEIFNVDGADFDLDFVEVASMTLTRKKR